MSNSQQIITNLKAHLIDSYKSKVRCQMLGGIMFGLGQLTLGDFGFIGLCLEGFLYGIYSGIFALYLQHHYSKQFTNPPRIFYSICTLYVLSIVQIAVDVTSYSLPVQATTLNYYFSVIPIVISGCCDFIAQSILIYRCRILWNGNIRIVIIPSILAVIFLGLWVAECGAIIYDASVDQVYSANWGNMLIETSLAISLTVNALVTSLIVFKIFKVYSQVKPFCTQTDGPSGGSKLRPIIFVIIESGMALFAVQLTRLVLAIVTTNTTFNAYTTIVSVHEMFNGITPTIIQVRVVMGLSFHDQPSLDEAISGLHFGSDQDSISRTGSDGIVDEESRYDAIGIQCQGGNDQESRDEDIVAVQPTNNDNDIIEVQRDDHLSIPQIQ